MKHLLGKSFCCTLGSCQFFQEVELKQRNKSWPNAVMKTHFASLLKFTLSVQQTSLCNLARLNQPWLNKLVRDLLSMRMEDKEENVL